MSSCFYTKDTLKGIRLICKNKKCKHIHSCKKINFYFQTIKKVVFLEALGKMGLKESLVVSNVLRDAEVQSPETRILGHQVNSDCDKLSH